MIAGIFVGGAGRRMGGRAKGMMRGPDGRTLVIRWAQTLFDAGVSDVMLVGSHGAYADVGLDAIDDDPPGVGPVGGLAALLRRAGKGRALALACDMPFVSRSLIARLVDAPDAPVVAPRPEGVWEPLCARYEAPRVLDVVLGRIAAGDYALWRVLDEAGAVELELRAGEEAELRDWDTPEDVERSLASLEPAD